MSSNSWFFSITSQTSHRWISRSPPADAACCGGTCRLCGRPSSLPASIHSAWEGRRSINKFLSFTTVTDLVQSGDQHIQLSDVVLQGPGLGFQPVQLIGILRLLHLQLAYLPVAVKKKDSHRFFPEQINNINTPSFSLPVVLFHCVCDALHFCK